MTIAIVVAWVSRNSNNVGNRSVASALYNVSGYHVRALND
jgi:hypothetical protein